MNSQQTKNHAFLNGFLEVSFKNLPELLIARDIIGYNSPVHQAIKQLVENEIKRAHKAEQEFSNGY